MSKGNEEIKYVDWMEYVSGFPMAFADISAIVGKAVVERGWIADKDLVHYNLHSEIDHRHAEEFFKVIEESWEDSQKRHFIKQGVELGAYIFDRLYKDPLSV